MSLEELPDEWCPAGTQQYYRHQLHEQIERKNKRIKELEALLNSIHESREMWKEQERDAATRVFQVSKWSGIWKHACKTWRERAKNEQRMVNERDEVVVRLREDLRKANEHIETLERLSSRRGSESMVE